MTDHLKARLLAASLFTGIGLAPALAVAGPCSSQITELGKALSNSPGLGAAPVTGTLTGSGPGSAPTDAPNPTIPLKGTSASDKLGGTAATKELNAAASNQIATSPQDVRRQQEGLPTAAATAASQGKGSTETAPKLGQAQSHDDHMAVAKSDLEQAVMLDHNNDPKCMDWIKQAQALTTKN